MDESRAIVIPTPGGSLTPQWWAAAYGPTTMFVTSLSATDPAQRKLLLAGLQEDADPKEMHLNVTLPLVHFLLKPAQKEEDGEIKEWIRSVLFLADGTMISFGSMGIVKSLMLIQQLDRMAPWNPPLLKQIRVGKTSKGRPWPTLVDPPETPKKPK